MNKETGMANNLEISIKEKLRETVRKNISDRIDTYIASTPDMTQYKFADMTGASRSSVNRWLNKKGNEMPPIYFLKPIADTIGITVDSLLTGNDVKLKTRSWPGLSVQRLR